MRKHGITDAYEQLKELTRGQHIDRDTLQRFVDQLQVPPEARQRLRELTPGTYTGNAAQVARDT